MKAKTTTRISPDYAPEFSFELRAYSDGAKLVCGVDEVGRGPLAGPVVAAAVILPLNADGQPDLPPGLLGEMNDSKKLSAASREQIHDVLLPLVCWGIGYASARQIDRVNILQATFAAMRRAVAALEKPPCHALIDGNKVPPGLACKGEPVVKGDARSYSIAAASIIAKVIRDRQMSQLAGRHPGYGWEQNAGYGTAAHRDAIIRLGLTRYHRRSFGGCR